MGGSTGRLIGLLLLLATAGVAGVQGMFADPRPPAASQGN